MAAIGYARVSTSDQTLDYQIDELTKAGCAKVFEEKISGSSSNRPELESCLNYLRENDILVVWSLDRLGRSLKHLIEIINNLNERKIGFKAIKQNIDTTTPTGRLTFHLFGAIAEFEREIIRERTKAGLDAARTRGKKGGRKPSLSKDQIAQLKTLYNSKQHTIPQLCSLFKISKSSLYRHIS